MLLLVMPPEVQSHPPELMNRLPRLGSTTTIERPEARPSTPYTRNIPRGRKRHLSILQSAERRAKGAARKVLSTARRMMEQRTIVRGSCWDWVNAVYKRAGYPNRRGKRKTIFKGSRKNKKFASINRIKSGDWLYYVNYQYKRVPHSGIFVGWINKRKKRALILSYRGARSRTPGGLSEYDLRSVYNIIRPQS